MIKKIKRYINSLNYKQAQHLIFSICFVLSFLNALYLFLNWNNLKFQNPQTLTPLFAIFIQVFLLPICIAFLLFLFWDVDSKRIDEKCEGEKKELENIFTSSNNTVELTVSDSTEFFPKDIILFYLEQKGTQFWIEFEKSENNKDINAKIYITDKDNPDKKIVYPDAVTNSLYIRSHFELKN